MMTKPGTKHPPLDVDVAHHLARDRRFLQDDVTSIPDDDAQLVTAGNESSQLEDTIGRSCSQLALLAAHFCQYLAKTD